MKTKYYILPFFLLFCFVTINAQTPAQKKVDDLINSAYESKDNKEAQIIASKAYDLAAKINDNYGKRSALFCKADLYLETRDDTKTLEFADKGIALADDDYFYQALGHRLKAYAYTNLGFYKKANTCIADAEKAAKKLEGDDYYDVMGRIYQGKSEIENMKEGSKIKVLDYNRKSLHYYEKIKNEIAREDVLPMQYYNLSFSLVRNGKSDSAIYYSRKAYHLAKKINVRLTEGLGIYGIAKGYFTKKNFDSALYYYKKAEPYFKNPLNPHKLQYVYEEMGSIYSQKGDNDKYAYYSKKALALQTSTQTKEKLNVDKVAKDVLEEEKKESNQKLYLTIAGFAIAIICFMVLTVKLLIRYKKIKELKRITEIGLIEKYEKQLAEKLNIRNNEKEKETTAVSSISDEKEHELMKKLNNFERKEQFLSSEISLGSLASTFNTNVNYLSKVIKKYRDNNFNSYINELRINYITKKLRTNPEYLNYKIAYLAEECGFSSYSSFVSIFKQQTGLTPSKFIEYLSKEEFNINQN